MDPDKVLANLRAAIAAGNAQDAMECADILDGWMTAGGYAPAAWTRLRGFAGADVNRIGGQL